MASRLTIWLCSLFEFCTIKAVNFLIGTNVSQGRYKLALDSLVQCDGRFEEVCSFVSSHSLHSHALSNFTAGTEQFKTISNMFAGSELTYV